MKTQIIADFLDQHRQAKGLSIYEVAKQSGASRSHVGSVFAGKTKPSAELFLTLCGVMGISKKEIFLLLVKLNDKK